MVSSKNTLNTTSRTIARLDKMIVFSILIIVMVLICVPLDASCQELGATIFLELESIQDLIIR
jgi:hypothetical protein